MLRVGLTGGLGSGKSTVARMLAAQGARVFSADEIGRELMQPGQAVYAAIVERFGPGVVTAEGTDRSPGGTLDRAALARIAFGEGRIGELEAIVHPATIARQAELIAELEVREPDAVVVVESALIFQTKYGETQYGGEGGWHKRFDRIIFVRADEDTRVARFVARASGGKALSEEERAALEAEARRRMANQAGTERNAELCDYVLTNDGSVEELQRQVDGLWRELEGAAQSGRA